MRQVRKKVLSTYIFPYLKGDFYYIQIVSLVWQNVILGLKIFSQNMVFFINNALLYYVI